VCAGAFARAGSAGLGLQVASTEMRDVEGAKAEKEAGLSVNHTQPCCFSWVCLCVLLSFLSCQRKIVVLGSTPDQLTHRVD